jgi:hypothetical protein
MDNGFGRTGSILKSHANGFTGLCTPIVEETDKRCKPRGPDNLPFGNSGRCWSRRDTVKIARRFNAGNTVAAEQAPKGRLKIRTERQVDRPSGT